MTEQLRWLTVVLLTMLSKIVYRDSSIDGLNERSVQQFMQYNGIEESPLIIAIINYIHD